MLPRDLLRNGLSGICVILGFAAPFLTFSNESLWGSNAAILVVMGSILGGLVLAGLVQRYL